MSDYTIMYQRNDYFYSSGPGIRAVKVTRQTDKCYWVLCDSWRGQDREARQIKKSNPPLHSTWEEAKRDLIDYCAEKAAAKNRAYEKAVANLNRAVALQPTEEAS